MKISYRLTACLFGDTGNHADMKVIVRNFHQADLAVLNPGLNALSPDAAAFVINKLMLPATVVASHPK